MRRQRRRHFLQVYAEFFGLDHKLLDLLPKQFRSLRLRSLRKLGDHRSNSREALEQTIREEPGHHLVRGVGIDLEFLTKKTNRGKRISRAELSRNDRFLRGIHDLLVQRNARPEVDAERNHR